MTKAPSDTLVLAGTGKTGRRLAAKLAKLGLSVRTAARNGADVHFDWDDATTHRAAVQGVDRLYFGRAGHANGLRRPGGNLPRSCGGRWRASRHLSERLWHRPGPATGRPASRRARPHR